MGIPIVVGVDPGLSGGAACTDGERFFTFPLAYEKVGDTPLLLSGDFLSWLSSLPTPTAFYVENVYNFPTDSRRAAFTFGWVAGMVTEACQSYAARVGATLHLTPPKTWQRDTLTPYMPVFEEKPTRQEKKKALKASSALFMASQFPSVSLLATPRSRVPHSGLSDACVLAFWGWQREARRTL